jgi:hypothetical protein
MEVSFYLYGAFGPAVSVHEADGVVESIYFRVSSQVSVQEMIRLSGEPESILLIRSGLTDKVVLLSPEGGIAMGYFYSGSAPLADQTIGPSTKLGFVEFFHPAFFDKLLDASEFSTVPLPRDEFLAGLHAWQGYGIFGEKYWPPIDFNGG